MADSDKRNSIRRGNRLSQLSVLLPVAAGIVWAVFLLFLGVTDNAEVRPGRTEKGYYKVEDYSCREIADANAPVGVKTEYTFLLDETLDRDTHLAFYTVHQYVEVYLDGENVYSLKPSEMKQSSKTVGSNWVMLPLYREDAGKEIRVDITPVYESFRDRKVEFLIGSELAIYRDRLSKDLPQIILSIMTIFVGLVFICVASYNLIKKHRGKALIALGVFSVMLGFWRLTDTRFTPFILPEKPVFLFYASVAMLMLGMVPFVKCIEEHFTQKIRAALEIYCIITALICLIQLMFQFLGIVDLRENLFVTHVLIGAGGCMVIGAAVYERLKYPQKYKGMVESKLPYICVAGAAADVIAFYLKGNSSGLLFSLLAFLLYIVFMGIATLFNYSEQQLQLAEDEHQLAEKDRQLAEKERKLTERRIAVMMSQIRTHFIFNVLTTISGYCKTDPKKADNALIRFARYLRKNIKIIEEEGLIDFQSELEQLEDCIALEQMRFGDMITFDKNIEVMDFHLPPLTIQPLVENAIKHGFVEHGRSGTVMLQTVKEKEHIRITIADDGVGFVPEKCEKEGSVGIKNVRYRLENMVGGSLIIESVPGKGTTVTVKIPIKEAGK